MRLVWLALLTCVHLLAWPSMVRAQTPDGLKPLGLLPGAFALNPVDITVRAGRVILARKPDTMVQLLRNFNLCADADRTAQRLRNEGLRTVTIGQAQSVRAMRAGTCQIYVTRSFDFSVLNRDPDDPDAGGAGRDDVGQTNEGRGNGDDVIPPQVRDRTPPKVTPLETRVRTTDRNTEVRVRVVDEQSPVSSVRLRLWDNRSVTMTLERGTTYVARIELPENYAEKIVVVEAKSRAPELGVSRISVARQPHCGPPQEVKSDLVKSVQSNLQCIGLKPGPIDGQQGQNTCRAIRGFLGNEITEFNSGKIGWSDLNQRLVPACRLAQPISLVFDSPVTRDAPGTTVEIDLNPAGAAAEIRVTPEGASGETRQWNGTSERYNLPMPRPGQQQRYTVDVIDEAKTLRDRKQLVLARPNAVLRISPPGPLVLDAQAIRVTAFVDVGADVIGRIEAQGADMPPQTEGYNSSGVDFDLPMPAPATARIVTFVAMDKQGQPLARAALTLERPGPVLPPPAAQVTAPLQPVPGRPALSGIINVALDVPPVRQPVPPRPDTPAAEKPTAVDTSTPSQVPVLPVELRVLAVGGAVTADEEVVLQIAVENPGDTRRITLTDQTTGLVLLDRLYDAQVLEETIRMPEPGQSAVIAVSARNASGRALAGSQIALARSVAPVITIPFWVWLAGISVFLAGGLLGLRFRKSAGNEGPDAPIRPPALVKPKVTVMRDDSPSLTLPDGDMPAVIFWVERPANPAVEIDMDPSKEDNE